jgi:hypothetical protein
MFMILGTGEHLPITLTLARIHNGSMQIEGFADVFEAAGFPDKVVGTGRYYNTAPTAGELAVAVLAATDINSTAAEIVHDKSIPNGQPVVEALRQEQALRGVCILDLGCGLVPTVAMAAKAMGAEVHTADGQQLPPALEGEFASHTVIDLTNETAPAALLEATRGNLAMVGEVNVSPFPGSPDLATPSLEQIKNIADSVLTEGGYLYSPFEDLMRKYEY